MKVEYHLMAPLQVIFDFLMDQLVLMKAGQMYIYANYRTLVENSMPDMNSITDRIRFELFNKRLIEV